MIYFTKYSEKKFDILNRHAIYLTREQIEECVNMPEKTGKKEKYKTAEKENIKVIYEKQEDKIKIVTFFTL